MGSSGSSEPEPEEQYDEDIGPTHSSDLSPSERRDIQAASAYARQREKQLEKLADQFDSMGNLGLFWDSKVPEKDKSFFYFFTFRLTDPEEVKAEIEKYLKFYREMREVASKISSGKNGEGTSQRNKDACDLINELHEHLAELSRAAEVGEKTTGSGAVYDLHREFVAKHEKLENLIRRVESVAVTKHRNQSLATIDRLERALDQSQDKVTTVCNKFHQLIARHEEVTEENRALGQVNDSLQEQNQELLERSSNQEEQLGTLQRRNEGLEQEKSELSQAIQVSDTRHQGVCAMFEQLFAKHEEVAEEKRVLERENGSLQEQNRQLLERSSNQDERLETLGQRNEGLEQEKSELEQKNERLENAIQELKEQQKELFEKNTMILNLLKTIAGDRGVIVP